MTTIATFSRQTIIGVGCVATALGLALAAATGHVGSSQPRIVAQCNDVDTEDSFSMSCVPSIMPDTSDQLTEQEVAEPGFNGGFDNHGGEDGPGGHGGPGGPGGEGGGHGGGGGGGGHGGR